MPKGLGAESKDPIPRLVAERTVEAEGCRRPAGTRGHGGQKPGAAMTR